MISVDCAAAARKEPVRDTVELFAKGKECLSSYLGLRQNLRSFPLLMS